jgi:hypothetical protein
LVAIVDDVAMAMMTCTVLDLQIAPSKFFGGMLPTGTAPGSRFGVTVLAGWCTCGKDDDVEDGNDDDDVDEDGDDEQK